MKLRFHKHFAFYVSCLLLSGLTLTCSLWVCKEQRQAALNRQLIEALKREDEKQALKLIAAGADPNTRHLPLPALTLPAKVNQLLHHPRSAVNTSQTALMLACGAMWESEAMGPTGRCTCIIARSPHPHLTRALLLRGADVNAIDADGQTALHVVVMYCLMNEPDKAVIKQLLEYGADPNQADKSGQTVLNWAKLNQSPDIVALLRKYNKRY